MQTRRSGTLEGGPVTSGCTDVGWRLDADRGTAAAAVRR